MQWFKLNAGFQNDQKIQHLRKKYGRDIVLFYLVLLSLLAEEYDGNPDKTFKIYYQNFKSSLGFSRENSQKTLRKLSENLEISVKVLPEFCEVFYPKFLKIQQRYKRDGCGKFTPHIETETETETEADIETETEGKISKEISMSPLVKIWNENCKNLPKVISISSKRKKHIKARMSETKDMAYWAKVVRRLAASRFCNGDNNNGWRASFDFLIKPDTHIKAIEGLYDNKDQQKKKVIF